MNIENLKAVEKLTARRAAAIDLRLGAAAASGVRIFLDLAGTTRSAGDVLPPDKVRAVLFEESTNEIIRVEAELAKLGAHATKPEPPQVASADAWKRDYGMYSRAWLRELGPFLGSNWHQIDALVTGTAAMRRAAEKPLLWASECLEWAAATFGPIARDRRERGLRFLEEALEVAQACGVEKEVTDKLVERAYSRPPGDLDKELGQAQACLAMLSFVADADAMANAKAEFARCKVIPKAEWDKRHAAKVAIGVAS